MLADQLYNEKEILLKIAKGDAPAFGQLFDHWSRHVYTLGLRLTKNHTFAEDLTQDIFTQLWVNRDKLAGVYHFKGYLNTVSKNLIRNFLNSKVWTVQNETLLLDYFKETITSAHEHLEFKEVDSAIREAIDQLPPQLQKVFKLSRLEGLSHEEIARELQLSKASVKSYIVRALILVREYLAKNYPLLLHVIALLLSKK